MRHVAIKAIYTVLATVPLLLCLSCHEGCWGSQDSDAPLPPAHITIVEGYAQVTVESPTGRRSVTAPAPLSIGERVRTTIDQALTIQFDDGSSVILGPASALRIERYQRPPPRQTVLELSYGILRSLVSRFTALGGLFEIHTPKSAMGVRGTVFFVEVLADGTTILHTTQGNVALAPNKTALARNAPIALVRAGSMSRAAPDGTISVPRPFVGQAFEKDLRHRYPLFFALTQSETSTRTGTDSSTPPAGDSGEHSLQFPNGLEPKRKRGP